MNKLTIARIYLGLIALGLVTLGVLFPEVGLFIFWISITAVVAFGLCWAVVVVFEDRGN